MGRKDARVDAYIAASGDFAKPILKELRKRVHASLPDVEESIRWSAPTFLHDGKLLAGMSAFKAHCSFGFWHPLLRRGDTSLEGRNGFGRFETLSDLPSTAAFAKLVRQARKLIDDDVKGPKRPPPAPDRKVVVPPDLAALLRKNAKARATFEGFPYSKRNDYVEWIVEAKREETRASRLATALEWLAEGKSRHWKYEQK
ncbi:hypothetical protein BWI17_06425 [Betaproteobacteria bacterium GR16-43]|nr:hypothetical protein BWI17_06425 [Betaproteobacteria bacterium GR16-43]